MIYQVNKPVHPEILVKIGPLDLEIPVLKIRPLKIKNQEKSTGKVYSLPCGLNNNY